MRLSISEILENASKYNSNQEIIDYLHKNDNQALRIILKYAYDNTIKWLLPEGPAPYTPSEILDQHGLLYTEARRLYLFVEGGNPNLSQMRRETLFIQLLEAADKKDAELLVAIKDKTLPYENITPDLVDEAFPGLLVEKVDNKKNSKIEKNPLDISQKIHKIENVKTKPQKPKSVVSEETRKKLSEKKLEYWKRRKAKEAETK
jgi:hypothetical protein